MSGYVASARVRGVPRLARTERVADRSFTFGPPDALRVIEVELDGEGSRDRSGERVAGRLVDRVAAFRERWSQLTFFLFDPNSWR